MHCTNCGREMPDGAEFCTGCGHGAPKPPVAAQPTPPPPAATPPAPAPKAGPNYWVLGCAGLLVLAIVGGVAIYFGMRGGPKPQVDPVLLVTPVTPSDEDADSIPELPDIEVPRPGSEGGLNVPRAHTGGNQLVEPDSDDEDAAYAVVQELFEAWANGDFARIRSISAPAIDAVFTDEKECSYESVSLDVELTARRGNGEYDFEVTEVSTANNTIAEETSVFAVYVDLTDGEFQVVGMQKLSSELVGMEGREEAEETLHAFFDAWEAGDLEAWKAQMTVEAAALATQDYVGHGYEQTGLEILYIKHPDEETWSFQVREDYTNSDGGEGWETYEIVIILEGGEWLVDNIFTFVDEDEADE